MSALEILSQILPHPQANPEMKASDFIQQYWQIYTQNYPSNPSINGKIFEELIALSLLRRGINPFYMQAQISFIANVNYDFVIYTDSIDPIVLSAKTSLRERYKQADLEAVVLKNIHRKSLSYVISLEEREVNSRRRNMDGIMAIDEFILANSPDYDDLLDKIAQYPIGLAPSIPVVSSNFLITKVSDRYK